MGTQAQIILVRGIPVESTKLVYCARGYFNSSLGALPRRGLPLRSNWCMHQHTCVWVWWSLHCPEFLPQMLRNINISSNMWVLCCLLTLLWAHYNHRGMDHYTAIRWLAHWPLMGGLMNDHLNIWYSDEGTGWAAAPPSPLLAVPNVTVHPSTARVPVPTSYYLM